MPMKQGLHVTSLWATFCLAAILGLSLAGCGPEYPNCDNDEDCHEGEFCVNGMCQMCRTNDDCPTGQQCTGGRCDPIPGFCQSTADCPDGQECRDNRCVAPVQSQTEMPEPEPTEQACSIEPVYFAFDSDNLQTGTRDTISANYRCMKEKGMSSVHLTGPADPRGTEEYNLALGARRARSVKQYLTSLGLEAGNVSVSSMGEEMASGSDESGWAQDRKVMFAAQ